METHIPPSPSSPPGSPAKAAKPAKPKKQVSLRVWILLIAIALFVIFIIQNSQEVEVNFLLIDARMPFYFALIVAGVLGAIIGWAISKMRKSEPKPAKK